MFAIPGTFISTAVTGLGLFYLPKFGIDLVLFILFKITAPWTHSQLCIRIIDISY
jgi:hypothetical protein